MTKKEDNTVNFQAVKATKEFIEEANERIFELENALYKILDAKDLVEAKDISADVLGEDLQEYLDGTEEESDYTPLDFENKIYRDEMHEDEDQG